MTEREFEQRLRGYYRTEVEAAGRMPAELREDVWDIPDVVPIARGQLVSRRTILLLAAAMLLALLVGTAIAVGSGLIPWLENDEPTQLSLPLSWARQEQTDMAAGTYYVDVASSEGLSPSSTIRVTFTLPRGWERVPVQELLWGQTMWIAFGVVTGVYVDPCRPQLGFDELPGDATPADVAAGLRTLPEFRVTSVTPTTLGGYIGVRVDITSPSDSSACVNEESRLLRIHGLYNYVPAMRDRAPMQVWILDVEGSLLVISSGQDPVSASDGDRVNLQGVIDSIEIGPSAH